METLFVCVLCFISVAASSSAGRCPPHPRVHPPCDNASLVDDTRSRGLTHDCHMTGCPKGKVCCTNYCGGYECVKAYTGPTRTCPPGLSQCSFNRPFRRRRGPSLQQLRGRPLVDPLEHIFSVDVNLCHANHECKDGFLCCLVNCRRECVKGQPIAFP